MHLNVGKLQIRGGMASNGITYSFTLIKLNKFYFFKNEKKLHKHEDINWCFL